MRGRSGYTMLAVTKKNCTEDPMGPVFSGRRFGHVSLFWSKVKSPHSVVPQGLRPRALWYAALSLSLCLSVSDGPRGTL